VDANRVMDGCVSDQSDEMRHCIRGAEVARTPEEHAHARPIAARTHALTIIPSNPTSSKSLYLLFLRFNLLQIITTAALVPVPESRRGASFMRVVDSRIGRGGGDVSKHSIQ
jgi:hypothetical protein